MRLLIKYPSRQRPDLFKKTLNRYYEYLSGKERVSFLISLDEDDESMNNPEMKVYLDSKPNLKYFYGQSKTKIQACNADLEKVEGEWDICLLASDDMIPEIKGYDNIICKQMIEFFPESEGVLWYNDGNLGGNRTMTLSIVGKRYYDLDGYIYNPAFESLWCDNQQTEVAKARNKLQYISRVIIKHHWIEVTGKDPLHQRNSDRDQYQKDGEIYENFKKSGFPELKTSCVLGKNAKIT